MATNIRVASRSPLAGLSPEQLAQFAQTAQQTMGVQAPIVEDPRQTVQAMVEQVPQLSTEPVAQDVNGVPMYPSNISTPQELAAVTQSPFAGREVYQPVLDESGNQIIDERTGEPMIRPVSMEDYQNQRSIEEARKMDIGSQIYSLAEDPFEQAKSFTQEVVGAEGDTLFDQSARYTEQLMDKDEIDRYADKAATTLGLFSSLGKNYLFDPSAKVTTEVTDGLKLPVGLLVAANLGINPEDKGSLGALSTIMGIAFAKSIDQTRREDKNNPAPKYNSQADDGTLMLDQINAVKHAAQNAFEKANIDMSPQDVESLSKAMVYGALYDGTLTAVPSDTGRPIIFANEDLKNSSSMIKVISDVVAGDSTRNRSSTSPNRSGAAITSGGENLTSKSIKIPGLVTKAAELTKDILGSIGTVFRTKDKLFATIEYDKIVDNVYAKRDETSGKFLYSEHPFAKRKGLSKTDYNRARDKVEPFEGYNRNNPEDVKRFEAMKNAQAADVMSMKLKQFEIAVSNAEKSPGVRFTEYMHSVFNQRFFPASFDTDYMGDKAFIRDMMGIASQEFSNATLLFNPAAVEDIKQKGSSILRMSGEKQHEALSKLSPVELGTIGTMINSVINYYSAVNGSNPDITSMAPPLLLEMYTPDIGNALADVGKKYNDFLNDPTLEDEQLYSLLAGMEKGESLGSKNLWDDLFQIRNNFKSPNVNKSVPLTHHSFDDGNQNGIFLQALFFGRSDSAIRLGTYNPSLDDMRVMSMETMVANLDRVLKDHEGKNDAFRMFFKDIKSAFGKDTIAKDFFKAPLMEASYSKDASMFGDLMLELILDNENYKPYAEKYLMQQYDSIYTAAKDLSDAVEMTLREVLDSTQTNMMKGIGRFTAVLNTVLMVPGISGDTSIFSPVTTQPVNKNAAARVPATKFKLSSGREVYIKQRDLETEQFSTPEGSIDVATGRMQYAPSYAKPSKIYYDRANDTYTEFNNVKGSAQARSTVVGPIQAMDGDLVKWTNIFLNKDRKVPYGALWVHDSIISTPGSSLLYRNAYNNIAIPKAIPEIAKFGKKFKDIVRNAQRKEVERVKALDTPVGIGDFGEYPALGALFDERFMQINPEDDGGFKKRFLSKSYNNTAKYEQFVAKTKAKLAEAEANGWVPANKIGREQKKMLAVTPKQFENLVNLAGEFLNMTGPSNKLDYWADNFENKVNKTARDLKEAASKYGNGQMTYDATGKKADVSKFIEEGDIARAENYINQYKGYIIE